MPTTPNASTVGSSHPRAGTLGQGVDDPAEPEDGEQPTDEVERQRPRRPVDLRDPQQHHEGREDERDVEQEDPTPRRVVDQPPAAVGAEGGPERCQARPDADAASAIGTAQGPVEQGEAARDDQGAAHALDQPGGDQGADRGRGRAAQRGDKHDDEADDEDPPAPEVIGQRAGEQQQRGDRDQVAGQHPLQLGHARVQVRADRGDRDVDHEGVEEPDHRCEDRRGDEGHTGRTAQREELPLRRVCVS